LAPGETPQEKTMFVPQNSFYQELATTCVKNGISVDLFVGSSIYSDIATLGELTKLTGGQAYYYPNFSAQAHGAQLYRELFRNFSREAGYDGLMRFRSSTGVTQSSQTGFFLKTNETDLSCAHISADSTLHVEFSYDEDLKDNHFAYFQCAYLYTTKQGERRIRTHNIRIPTASTLVKIFKAADLDATLNILIRNAVNEIPKDSMANIRNKFLDTVIEILASYRGYCAKTPATGQLILPESLRLLPIYSLGLLKSPLMGPLQRGSLFTVLPDARSYLMLAHQSISMKDQSALIYPTIYNITDLAYNPKFGVIHENGFMIFPGMVRPTAESLTTDGIFLIDAMDFLYLWIGRDVNSEIVDQLLSKEEQTPEVIASMIPLTKKETDMSDRLFNLLSSRNLQRTSAPELLVIFQGSAYEAFIQALLVEDGDPSTNDTKVMTYSDFLRHAHSFIQKKNKDKK